MATLLTQDQQARAIEALRGYLSAPKEDDGKTPKERQTQRDCSRIELIETKLRPLLTEFLEGRLGMAEFKSRNDSINKSHNHWGFRGIKGQMFFNMVVNVAADQDECCRAIKSAIRVPPNDDEAQSRIREFYAYVKRLGDDLIARGGSKRETPKIGSTPFFLSYFWQIQNRDVWPVFYTNAVNTMTDLNLWRPTGDAAEDYRCYRALFSELAALFTKASAEPFGFYDVEHVFWYKGGSPFDPADTLPPGSAKPSPAIKPQSVVTTEHAESIMRLPESYVPPIVAILPRLARHEEQMIEAAKASGTTVERAFEKYIHAAFTILTYETTALGQGQGRVPDGLAIARDERYGIIWDAKVRASGYGIGTDDRAIREYIVTQCRDLKRRHSLRNVYYAIISSGFLDGYDEAIRTLKMETEINEVCLLEADALVAMVDLKLRDPSEISLGSAGLQRLFSESGLVNAEYVREMLQ